MNLLRLRRSFGRATDRATAVDGWVRRSLPRGGAPAFLASVVLAAWYTWGSMPASLWLVASRPAMEPLSTADLRERYPEDPEVIARVDRMEAAFAAEETWNRVVDGCVGPSQREDGLARAAELAPLQAPSGSVEPELAALVPALVARYGPTPSNKTPDAVKLWTTVDRRTRARVALALVRGPGLDPACAPAVLGASEDLLRANTDRFNSENELRSMLAIR